MATIIKIKRSSGTSTPNLGQGELGYSWGTYTYSDFTTSGTVNASGKMFLGTGTETGGIAANSEIIGGKYFTEMLDHQHGNLTANSALIVDSASKINILNVDNITLDLNTISTTNSNGDLNIDTNGTGDVNILGAATSGTNLFNITDGSTTRFSVDSFSGATTISSPALTASEELLNISSTWNNAAGTFYGIKFDVTNTASGANSRLLDLQVGGSSQFNVDTSGNLTLQGNITTAGTTDLVLPDNTTGALTIREGANNYLKFDTTDTSELITFGNTLTSINEVIKDNVANAYALKEGANQYIAVDTTNGSELVKFETGNVQITNDLAVNGGDLTTTATTFNLLASPTTVNIAAAATTLALGNTGTAARTVNIGTAATAGASTLNFGGAVTGNTFEINSTTSGTINLTSDVTTGTVNLYTGVTTGTTNIATGGASTINLAGTAGSVNVGTTTGNSTLTIRGNGTTGTASLATNVTTGTANLFTGITTGTTNIATGGANTTNIGGAASTVNIGTTGGNSILEVRGNSTTGTATIRTNSGVTTVNVFDTVATTGNLFGAATTVAIATTGTGARTVNVATAATAGASTMTFGGAVTGNTFKIAGTAAGTTNLTSDVTTGTVNLYTGVTSGTMNYGSASTLHDFGNVNIQGNVISSDTVGATQLILDPFPTGGDSAGEVLIRGNLTVNGTTTTVNSTEISVNDPIFTLGDAVTTKMVLDNASSTATSIRIDNPTGVVETSTITGSGVAGGTTITNVRTRFYTSAQMAGTQTAGTTVIYTYNTSTTTYEAIGTYASKGANFLEIDLNPNIALREDDYYVGFELRDANTGTPNSAIIARDPANNKVFTNGATLTLSTGLSSGITAPQEVTISQGADDNMDRGVQFKYYNGGLKTGFFGYDESGAVEDVTTYYFTYIPDSTNTNNVFTGTVGSAYFKTVKINDGITNGIAFYDTYKRLTTTVAAGTSDETTSNQILTVNGSGVPVWTTTIDGGTY